MTINLTALSYLAAFDARQPIQNGLAFEDELRACQLDYSVASLERIDTLLDTVRERHQATREALLDSPPMQSFLFLLAFYVGEVIGRTLGTAPQWLSYDEMLAIDPKHDIFGQGIESFFTLRFPPGMARIDFFMPLYALTVRLTESGDEKSVYFSASANIPAQYRRGQPDFARPLPPLPPVAWPHDYKASYGFLAASEIQAMRLTVPEWVAGDALARLFAHGDALLDGGRVVWGALVQANNILFKPKPYDGAPGEVLYDPQGRLDRESLVTLARICMNLKRADDVAADLQPIATHLKAETSRAFGLDAPLAPYPVKLATTYFQRSHLAGGCITTTTFPILIHDQYPGLVRPLPHLLWPKEFKAEWLGKPQAPTPAPAPRPAASPRPTPPEPRPGKGLFARVLGAFGGKS